jgi:hypothetical protein
VRWDTRCAGEGLKSPKDAAKKRVEGVCSEEERVRGEHRGLPGIQHCAYHLQALRRQPQIPGGSIGQAGLVRVRVSVSP